MSGKALQTLMLLAAALVLSGCRGRAHEDVYRAKMANEIRVLEDQLYEADYQNRVLRDELDRTRQSMRSSRPDGTEKTRQSEDDYDLLDLDPDTLDAPFLEEDATESVPPQATQKELPKPPPLPDSPKSTPANEKETNQPLVDPPASDPRGGLGMPSESIPTPVPDDPNHSGEELPPPSELPVPKTLPPAELVPPGEGELMDEQIIPGPPKPPADDPESPPGKIISPPNAKTLRFDPPEEVPIPVPDRLELHDGLSGGHQFDDDSEIDGLYLIVTVVDESGVPLSLDGFDVDADMTIVVTDPANESEDARVGRWEFKPDEVREMIRKTPIDGIHIPIAWQDRVPSGDDVEVHVRMAAAEEKMECHGKVRLEETVAASSWLPRG